MSKIMASSPPSTKLSPGEGEGGAGGAGGGGGGGGGKRRSFLPSPYKRPSGIPTPSSSTSSLTQAGLNTSISSSVSQPPGHSRNSSSGSVCSSLRSFPADDVDPNPTPKGGGGGFDGGGGGGGGGGLDAQEVIPGAERLQVGQKVLISGVKPGILRFVGRTHIAPGFWCGVELHDASGLHDGEVDGTRYFTCKPFRGIFAPVDKVEPAVSPPPPMLVSSPPDENQRGQITDYSSSSAASSSSSSRYGGERSSRLPGLARAESADKLRGDSSSSFNRRSYGGQDSGGGFHKASRMSASYTEGQDVERGGEDGENGSYSRQVKEHLQSDSRRYFNLTFGRDTPPPHPQPQPSHHHQHHSQNLPDLVSSVSPPSSTGGDGGGGGGGPCDTSDIHLGFPKDAAGGVGGGGGAGGVSGRGVPPSHSSSSDTSGSSQGDASVATVHEMVHGERRPLRSSTANAGEQHREKEKRPESPSNRARSLSPATTLEGEPHPQRTSTPRCSSRSSRTTTTIEGGGGEKGEAHHPHHHHQLQRCQLQDEENGSNEVSPEVSQVLEWDYDHDAFEGTGGPPGVGRGLNPEETVRPVDRHSSQKPSLDEESEETEEEEEEEEEETSEEEEEEETESEEEETETEEEESDDEEEEETEEEESEEEEEGESEDDRIEADRNAPTARAATVKTGNSGNAVAAPVSGQTTSGEPQGQPPSAAGVVSSEMTESTTSVGVSQKQESDATTKDGGQPTTSEPKPETSQKATSSSAMTGKPSSAKQKASAAGAAAGAGGAGGSKSGSSSQKPKKKRSTPDNPEDKKIVAQHKKAIKKAHSRLADYINAPLPPPKPKEEKEKKKKEKDKDKKTKKKKKGDDDGKEKTEEEKAKEKEEEEKRRKERRQPRVKEEKPKVKRTVVKSKWGNIMSQIEASKTTVKIKPKAEIQSSLALYLSTPPPAPPSSTSTTSPPSADPTKSESPTKPVKPKPKLIKHPKPDFSNIKSKLNITPPPPLPRRDSNANKASSPKGSGSPGPGAKPSEPRSGRVNVSRKPPLPKFNEKGSQGTGSCGSLNNAGDGNVVSRAGSRLRSERGPSTSSTKSDVTQRVKSMNQRNTEQKTSVRSSIPPAAARKGSTPGDVGARHSPSPPKANNRPGWGTGGTADQNRSRTSKGTSSPGLKSGQPPDVVSTSAPRGSSSRNQEVSRLESLCEARTKELVHAKMKLKESVQAFDAMACLLNYCTTELDAFSCPAVSKKLETATEKLTEQQQILDGIKQENGQLERQVQEVQEARDKAQQEAARLQEEIRQAQETHSAAQQKLQDDHSAALAKLKEEISSQHHTTLEKMQKYQENQTEHTRQSHNRQLVELTSEHQMATNQLKVQHLEHIQELCNKHELQIQDLHVQHRKKLEDITDRFESIKLSLTDKVQSLCSECDDLRLRAKSSEEALQRDADVKVQFALTPYLHLPKEIESLKTVIDMRTEEIQKLRRQNMDLVKQLEELPIAQERVVSLQQKVENLQAIINIKTDHEKQLHEKCQVLMRKYDRESRANKRMSMEYEQAVWRMSQSADFSTTGSMENISPRPGGAGGPLSRSPSRGGSVQPCHSHGSSPVRSLSSSSQADNGGGVVLRGRHSQVSSTTTQEQDQRQRANTFSSDTTSRLRRPRGYAGDEGSPTGSKRRGMSKSGDYSSMVATSTSASSPPRCVLPPGHKDMKDQDDPDESFSSSGHESGDTSDFFSSLESNVILETAQGVSFSLVDRSISNASTTDAGLGSLTHDDVFMDEAAAAAAMVMLQPIQDASPEEVSSSSPATLSSTAPGSQPRSQRDASNSQTSDVTVVVTSPSAL